MRLFSTKRRQTAPARKAGRKVLIVTGVMLALFMAAPAVSNAGGPSFGGITAYAAEQAQQTPNWFQDVDGAWKVKDQHGNLVSNSWFCDLDGSWYLMDERGCMREGIINDGGHYYSLETSHAGHYGMMRTANGVYDNVALTFNQEHNGFYGEILSGAQELISTGVKVTTVNGLPAASVYAKDFVGGSLGNQQVNNNQQQQQQVVDNQQSQSTGKGSFWDSQVVGETSHIAGWDEMSPEAQAAVINSLKHGGVH